jgi:hypothetical protein
MSYRIKLILAVDSELRIEREPGTMSPSQARAHVAELMRLLSEPNGLDGFLTHHRGRGTELRDNVTGPVAGYFGVERDEEEGGA